MVAIVILSILAAIAIGSFSERGSDRVPAAARQLRSMLAGAQSRAAKDQKPRGLRLIADPSLYDAASPKTRGGFSTSLVYVGSDEVAGNVMLQNSTGGGGWGWIVTETLPAMTPSVWSDLVNDLVDDNRNNARLQVGRQMFLRRSTDAANEEVAFVVSEIVSEDTDGDGFLDAGEDMNMNSKIDVTNIRLTGPQPPSAAIGAVLVYRLEGAPQVLANTEPVTLPRGTAIDLYASLQWSFQPGGVMSGTTEQFPDIDIMFNPRGGVDPARISDSVMHLYVGEIEDSLNSRPTGMMTRPYYVSNAILPQRIVSLFATTGQVKTSEYSIDDPSTTSQYEQFTFAVGGKEAK